MNKEDKAMKQLKDLIVQDYKPNFLQHPGVDLLKINELKHYFLMVARSICPDYQIRQEQKPLINDIFNWCIKVNGRYNPDKGLWIWGDIGIGKSTLLEIVRGFCHDVRPHADDGSGYMMPYSFRTTNAIEVCSEFSRHGYAGIDTYIKSSRQAFDELGSESCPTGYYGTVENVFQYVLQRRYDSRFVNFTHVTTNMTIDEISDRYGARIYDRCKEMFNFVEMRGATWRKKR